MIVAGKRDKGWNSSMKLMADVRTMASQPSGVGIYIYNFLIEILRDPDIELVLISDVDESGQMQEMKQKGIRVILYGERVFRSVGVFRYFSFVKKEVLREHPDLFWEPNNLLPVKLNGFRGKILLTLHDVFPITHAKYFNKLYPAYFRFFLKKSVSNSDVLLYNSEETKKGVEMYAPQARKKASFLTYVIVPDESNNGMDDIQESGQEKKDIQMQDCFFYIGNLEGRKGTDRLLLAYEEYYRRGGRRKLYLAGGIKDSYIRDYMQRVQQVVGDSLQYMGYVDLKDKQRLIHKGGCFLFPSRAEGFGIPLIEVMQKNVPVIASQLSIFREIIGDCIHYYASGQNEKEEIMNLADAMVLYDHGDIQVNHDQYRIVTEKYSSGNLGQAFLRYLHTL